MANIKVITISDCESCPNSETDEWPYRVWCRIVRCRKDGCREVPIIENEGALIPDWCNLEDA